MKSYWFVFYPKANYIKWKNEVELVDLSQRLGIKLIYSMSYSLPAKLVNHRIIQSHRLFQKSAALLVSDTNHNFSSASSNLAVKHSEKMSPGSEWEPLFL